MTLFFWHLGALGLCVAQRGCHVHARVNKLGASDMCLHSRGHGTRQNEI